MMGDRWNATYSVMDLIWGLAFFVVWIIILFIGKSRQRSPLEMERITSRYGLNGLLEVYKRERNNVVLVAFSFLMLFPLLFLISGPGSFITALTAMTGISLFRIRGDTKLALGELSPSADYRKEARKFVSGGGYNALDLLDRLDEEVRRGEAILQYFPKGMDYIYGCSYHLYPSAIVAGTRYFSSKPRIIPTDSVASMGYSDYYSDEVTFHFVHLYDEHKKELCRVNTNSREHAANLMSELKQRFGASVVQKTVKRSIFRL